MRRSYLTLNAQVPGTVNGADVRKNSKTSQLMVCVDITARVGTATLTVTIEGRDPVSGKYITLLQSTALAAVGTTLLRVGLGNTVTANLSANSAVPPEYRVTAVVATATSITATISIAEMEI